jgi:DNA-binding HxlR family transcriptional regulator
MRHSAFSDAECAIAQALAVVGDWWTLLVVRDMVGGIHRFDELQAELGVSRKVLAERLVSLVEHGVLDKRLYQPELAQAIAVLARAQQDAVWARTAAHNKLRSHLREYFPGFPPPATASCGPRPGPSWPPPPPRPRPPG